MRGSTEREQRWILVEALCFCAAAEREPEAVKTWTIHPRVLAQSRKLTAQARRRVAFWGLAPAATAQRFEPEMACGWPVTGVSAL